jgi:hypothetical protein
MLEKFREKKLTVVVALREACDSSFLAVSLFVLKLKKHLDGV